MQDAIRSLIFRILSFIRNIMYRIFNFIKNAVNKMFNKDEYDKDRDHDLSDHLDPENPFELDLGGSG